MKFVDDLKNCKSCAERRAAIAAYMKRLASWGGIGVPPVPFDIPPTTGPLATRSPHPPSSMPPGIDAQRPPDKKT